MIKPLAILGTFLVLVLDPAFQHATMARRLMTMGAVVGATFALGAFRNRVAARRRPTPQRPAATYYPPAPAPAQRSRGRSGRR
jgi:hypothetical protein